MISFIAILTGSTVTNPDRQITPPQSEMLALPPAEMLEQPEPPAEVLEQPEPSKNPFSPSVLVPALAAKIEEPAKLPVKVEQLEEEVQMIERDVITEASKLEEALQTLQLQEEEKNVPPAKKPATKKKK